MGKRWNWGGRCVFPLILLLHVAAILIFIRGFLLTRTELPYFSTCSDVSKSPCSFPHDDFDTTELNQNSSGLCWGKPAVDRIVIVVLDALRFDFLAPSTFFEEPKPWMDKLRVLQKLASGGRGSSARIFKAIADPPTTSLQRLKGLTTGGLPTFVDVGNSFGAPAITEDNWIHQLVQNGKRVVMMGDDTWTQLFPHHFHKAYPFPSFNVKDLHTVDNGCIDNLIPSLQEEDWDVLIAHFLGVDHAGHIFGVNSIPMIEKLEQYNSFLEKVIEVLGNHSGPGGLHENTILIVMGDHGQTLNGDHGGGGPEEVETSIFAMNFKTSPSFIPSELDTSSCELDLESEITCISSIQQLDFAATISALLDIPFPFGSIGRVNPELYALGIGSKNVESNNTESCQNQSQLEVWMWNYVNVLCTNSWQVKRYIDVYSASSVIGFSSEDVASITDMYAQAEENRLLAVRKFSHYANESCDMSLPILKKQIDAYFNFLANVAELARSKWTEFNMIMMVTGVGIMLISLVIHIISINKVTKQYSTSFLKVEDFGISFELAFAVFLVAVRACSLLSNSYILEEGKVANFLLATTGIAKLLGSVRKKKRLFEAIVFLLLIIVLRFTIEVGLSKQAATSAFLNISPSWMFVTATGHPVWTYVAEVVPILALILLACLLNKSITKFSSGWISKCVIMATVLSYVLLALHYISEGKIWNLAVVHESIGKSLIPRMIYAIGFGQLLLLALAHLFNGVKALGDQESLPNKTVCMVCAWSSTIIMLLGKQGPLVALASIIGGYCIMRLENVEVEVNGLSSGSLRLEPLSVTQWHLLAACLFFGTGHWCAFDGLRYGAAFIGFDEFILVRQAILLTVDTFGFSLILPILGLPFLIVPQCHAGLQRRKFILLRLSQVYLIYGFIMATIVTVTIICVTIQRRHLMVWGLFAPKFVFDVAGLILTDLLICLASLYYFFREEHGDGQREQTTAKRTPYHHRSD